MSNTGLCNQGKSQNGNQPVYCYVEATVQCQPPCNAGCHDSVTRKKSKWQSTCASAALMPPYNAKMTINLCIGHSAMLGWLWVDCFQAKMAINLCVSCIEATIEAGKRPKWQSTYASASLRPLYNAGCHAMLGWPVWVGCFLFFLLCAFCHPEPSNLPGNCCVRKSQNDNQPVCWLQWGHHAMLGWAVGWTRGKTK